MEQLQKIKDELLKQYNDLCERHDNLCEAYEDIERSLTDNNSNRKKTLENIQKNIFTRIELEKLDNRITVLSKVIDNLAVYVSLFEQGIITLPNDLLESKETINQKLLTLLEIEYKELDTLSTKKVLSNEFKTERLKGMNKYKFGPNIILGALISAYCVWMPFVYITSPFLSLSNILLSLVITSSCGIVGACHLSKKSIQKRINVFNILNNQLGNEALPFENDDTKDEQLELEELIDEKIHKITTVLLKQKEYQMLINLTSEAQNPQLIPENVINREISFKFQPNATIKEPDIKPVTTIPQYDPNRIGPKRALTPPHKKHNK